MIPHEVITPFSVEWWVYNVVTCFLIFITIWIGKNLAKKNENTLTLGIAYLFIFEFFFMDLYNIYIGLWSI
jgi:hypothetical protein